MNKWLKISLWSLFGVASVVLLVLTQRALNELIVKKPEVQISVTGENSFLSENELIARLERNNFLFVHQRVKDLNTEKIEQFIRGFEEVRNVKVFTHLNASWNIDIELRKPIAHIFNNVGQNYYLDADGHTISSSVDHTARVLVVSGDIPDRFGQESVSIIINNDSLKTIRKLDDVYRISNYVCNDPLMQSLIGQIHRENNGDFVLIPLVGGQKIIFGSALTDQDVAEKFKKLKIFYNEAIPYEGWGKYSEISLKYDNQIVCKRKE